MFLTTAPPLGVCGGGGGGGGPTGMTRSQPWIGKDNGVELVVSLFNGAYIGLISTHSHHLSSAKALTRQRNTLAGSTTDG